MDLQVQSFRLEAFPRRVSKTYKRMPATSEQCHKDSSQESKRNVKEIIASQCLTMDCLSVEKCRSPRKLEKNNLVPVPRARRNLQQLSGKKFKKQSINIPRKRGTLLFPDEIHEQIDSEDMTNRTKIKIRSSNKSYIKEIFSGKVQTTEQTNLSQNGSIESSSKAKLKKIGNKRKLKQFMMNVLMRTKVDQEIVIKRSQFQPNNHISKNRSQIQQKRMNNEQPNGGNLEPIRQRVEEQKVIHSSRKVSVIRKQSKVNMQQRSQRSEVKLPSINQYKKIVDMVKKEQERKNKNRKQENPQMRANQINKEEIGKEEYIQQIIGQKQANAKKQTIECERIPQEIEEDLSKNQFI